MAQLGKAGSYSAFVFDLDGTLIRLPVRWDDVISDLQDLFGVQRPLGPAFSTLAKLLEERPEMRKASFDIIDRYEMESISSAVPIRGSADLVRALAGRGSVCVVTMQGRAACAASLEKLGVLSRVKAMVTREDSLTRSGQIMIALGHAGAGPKEALFVGDLPNDVAEAGKAGVEIAVIGDSDLGAGAGRAFATCRELFEFLLS